MASRRISCPDKPLMCLSTFNGCSTHPLNVDKVTPGRLLPLDDVLPILKGRRRHCLHGKSTWGMRAGRPRTRKAAWPPRGPAAFCLRGAPESPQTKEGDPLGSPSPRCLSRVSPPLARATRPGGRRRPSLPQGRPCSTLGAGRLNFRVRYGSGCAPAAVAAGPRGALRRGLRGGG